MSTTTPYMLPGQSPTRRNVSTPLPSHTILHKSATQVSNDRSSTAFGEAPPDKERQTTVNGEQRQKNVGGADWPGYDRDDIRRRESRARFGWFGMMLLEMLGCYFFGMIVATAAGTGVSNLGLGVIIGFVYFVLASFIGPIAGAHFNPVITLGLMCLQKISYMTGLGYVLIAQPIGYVLAALTTWIWLDPASTALGAPGLGVGVTVITAFWIEIFVGMVFFFSFFFIVCMVLERRRYFDTGDNVIAAGGRGAVGVFMGGFYEMDCKVGEKLSRYERLLSILGDRITSDPALAMGFLLGAISVATGLTSGGSFNPYRYLFAAAISGTMGAEWWALIFGSMIGGFVAVLLVAGFLWWVSSMLSDDPPMVQPAGEL